MRHLTHRIFLILGLAALALSGCSENPADPGSGEALSANTDAVGLDSADKHGFHGRRGGVAVIANRASGTISLIDGRSFEVTDTIGLPAVDGGSTPEPMYVVHVPRARRVFVGDRANNRVVAFDDRTFAFEGDVAAGNGVFHMWADGLGRQLWVNNDVDNTTTVIDPRSLAVLGTVPAPADLVAMGGKPHDVILGPLGRLAYVTVLGTPGVNDHVIQYDTRTFAEIGRAAVGKDPHVSLARQNRWLYVPCQNSDQVVVLNRFTMEQETIIATPGAHGAIMAPNGRTFYTTNLPGGGTDALQAIDTRRNRLLGDPVDTPYAVPHNLALDGRGRTLFVTHSGATSDKVTIYRIGHRSRLPEYAGEATVGLNPFGLAYVR